MLAYTTVGSPLGELVVMASSQGIVHVSFAGRGHSYVLASVTRLLGEEPVWNPSPFTHARTQIDEYFSGRRHRFELDLDWSLSTGFYAEVRRLLADIPYAHTLSYSQLAERAGRPHAQRAVAQALARNPLPILLPCHRVIRQDGNIGGYLGGIEAKRWLLTFEASHSM